MNKGYIVCEESVKSGYNIKAAIQTTVKKFLETKEIYGHFFEDLVQAKKFVKKEREERKSSFYKGYKHSFKIIPVEDCRFTENMDYTDGWITRCIVSEKVVNALKEIINPDLEKIKEKKVQVAEKRMKSYQQSVETNRRIGVAILPYRADISFWTKDSNYPMSVIRVPNFGFVAASGKPDGYEYLNKYKLAFHDQHPNRVIAKWSEDRKLESLSAEDAIKIWGNGKKLQMSGCLK